MARNLPIHVQLQAVDIWLLPSTIILRDDDKLFDQCIETAYLTNKEVTLTGDFNINFLSQEFKKHYLSKSLMNMHFSQLVSDVT
jgi:hypothetical protein